jgi:hypothetical protein
MAALPHRRACTYASQHVDNSDLEPVNPRRGAGTRRENSDLNSSYCLPRTRRMASRHGVGEPHTLVASAAALGTNVGGGVEEGDGLYRQ